MCVVSGKFDVDTHDVVEVGGTFIAPSHTALINFGARLGVRVYNWSTDSAARDAANSSSHARHRHRAGGMEPADVWPWWWWGVDTKAEPAPQQLSIFFGADGPFTFTTAQELKARMRNATFMDLERVGVEMDKASQSVACEQCGAFGPDIRRWNHIFRFHGVVSVTRCVLSCTFRKVLAVLFKLMTLWEIMGVGRTLAGRSTTPSHLRAGFVR